MQRVMSMQRDQNLRVSVLDLNEFFLGVDENGKEIFVGRENRSQEGRLHHEMVIELHPQMTVFLGKNSSGKSSVIHALASLREPTFGKRSLLWEKDDSRYRRSRVLARHIDPSRLFSRIKTALGQRVSEVEDNDLSLPFHDAVHFMPKLGLKAYGSFQDMALADSAFKAMKGDGEILERISRRVKAVLGRPIKVVLSDFNYGFVDLDGFSACFYSPSGSKVASLYGVVDVDESGYRFLSYAFLSRGLQTILSLCTLIEVELFDSRNLSIKPVLLFDEPGAGLHPAARKAMFEMLKELSQIRQVVIATHDLEFMPDEDDQIRIVEREGHGLVTVRRPDWHLHQKELSPYVKASKLDLIDHVFRDKVPLLLEGVSDQAFLLAVLQHPAYEGPQLHRSLQPVPVGGTKEIIKMIPMLKARAGEGEEAPVLVLMDTDQRPAARAEIRGELKPGSLLLLGNYGRLRDQCGCHSGGYEDCRRRSRGELPPPATKTVTCRLGQIEDMFEREEYIGMFNKAFKLEQKLPVKATDAEAQMSIVDWIDERLKTHPDAAQRGQESPLKKIQLQKDRSDKWNFHGMVGSWFDLHAEEMTLSEATLGRFADLVTAINERAVEIQRGRSAQD